MKKFTYWNYNEDCPLAVKVGYTMNDCGNPTEHLKKMDEVFANPMEMFKFMCTCLAYWSETEYYDLRNQYAVLHSRKIVEHFPEIKKLAERCDDSLLKEAYGFTMSEHRYLQNEFFKVILERYKQNTDSVWLWLNDMNFVYNDDNTDLIPYDEYKAKRGW